MNISPIIAIPPLPEGAPAGNATSVPAISSPPAIPEVAPVPAAASLEAANRERQPSERHDEELPSRFVAPRDSKASANRDARTEETSGRPATAEGPTRRGIEAYARNTSEALGREAIHQVDASA